MNNQIDNRNSGLDLLKIISMLLVVSVHVIGLGGICENTLSGTLNYYFSYIIYTISFCSVNSYAMITGYTNVSKRTLNFLRYINLWLSVFFWSVFIYIAAVIFTNVDFIKLDFVKCCFPVLSKQYWYFSSYTFLFFLSPLLNKGLLTLSARQLKIILLLILFAVSAMPLVLFADPFSLFNGYTPIWLIIMYIFGAEIRLITNEKPVSKHGSVVIFVICLIMTITIRQLILNVHTSGETSFSPDLLINYTSPTIIIMSASLLIFFSKVNIQNHNCKKVIKHISRLGFGVYLIHVHPFVFSNVIIGKFTNFATLSFPLLVGNFLFTVLKIFAICLSFEAIRELAFRLIQIPKFCKYIGTKISKFYYSFEIINSS